MTAKVLPMKFRGQKFRGRPVDRENLENHIPQKFVRIRYTIRPTVVLGGLPQLSYILKLATATK